jgi:AraC family L-rhamnose operon transcriptional activator RhaR/AraC family L-rhamnose operon regulatory protein RhaS
MAMISSHPNHPADMAMKIQNLKAFDNGEIPIKIVTLVQSSIELHKHEYSELVVVLRGSGTHCTAKLNYIIKAGDIFYVKPGYVHGYSDPVNLKLANIMYFPRKIGIPLNDIVGLPGYKAIFELEPDLRNSGRFNSRLNLNIADLSFVEKLLNSIKSELWSVNPGRIFMAVSYLMQLIGFISRSYETNLNPDTRALFNIGRIVNHIESTYFDKFILNDIARKFNMSPCTLIRAFKRATGSTPGLYAQKFKIQKASELLVAPDATISAVAYRSGFSDSNYFSRQFKRHTGMSPKKFRAIYLKMNICPP